MAKAQDLVVTRYAWPCALMAAWVLYLAAVAGRDLWQHIGVPHPTQYFGDIYGVLAAAECSELGYNVYVQNPCDRWGAPHVYSTAWLWMGRLGLGRSDAHWMGAVIGAMFMLVAATVMRPSNAREFLWSLLVLLSPTTTLAIERANGDLVVFALVCVATSLAAGNSGPGRLVGLLVAIAATVLKIYPVVVATVIVVIEESQRLRRSMVAVAALLLLLWLAVSLDDLKSLVRVVPHPHGPYTFGAALLFDYLDLRERAQGLTIALALVALAAAIGVSMAMNPQPDHSDRGRGRFVKFACGVGVLLFTFLANTNYDYRCVFFILLMPLLFDLECDAASDRATRIVAGSCLALIVVISWSEALIAVFPAPIALLLDLDIAGRWSETIPTALRIVEHASTWIALTLLTAIGIRIAIVRAAIR